MDCNCRRRAPMKAPRDASFSPPPPTTPAISLLSLPLSPLMRSPSTVDEASEVISCPNLT